MGIIVISPGGSGSSFIGNALSAHTRPDVVFSPLDAGAKAKKDIIPENLELNLEDLPTIFHEEQFIKRTIEYPLNLNISIEKNMVEYLQGIIESNNNSLLCGAISRVGPFFRRNQHNWNGESIICFIRHPLHSMISFLLHQHPESTGRYGVLSQNCCLIQYAMLWKKIVKDAIEGGLSIIRYEYAKKDLQKLKSEKIKTIFANWNEGKRNNGILPDRASAYLKELVWNIYCQLYERWDI